MARVAVQEIRVTAGVFGDDDVEPSLYLGRCEGSEHLSGLIDLMLSTMLAEHSDRGVEDHFWQARTVWVQVEPDISGGDLDG